MECRLAETSDAEAICRIYNQGIQDGNATFETRPREPEEIMKWIGGEYPVMVVYDEGELAGFAASFQYSQRECYSGVAEFSVYVDRTRRRLGAGKAVMTGLIEELRRRGFWKLVSRVFPENSGSRSLLGKLGFREVGEYKNHGVMNGRFRDVVIVKFLIA